MRKTNQLIYGTRTSPYGGLIIGDDGVYPPRGVWAFLNEYIIGHHKGIQDAVKYLGVQAKEDLKIKFSIERAAAGELAVAQAFTHVDTPIISRANCQAIEDNGVRVTSFAPRDFADIEVEYDAWKMIVEVSVKDPMDKVAFNKQLMGAMKHMLATESELAILVTRIGLSDKKMFDVHETFTKFCEKYKERLGEAKIVPISFQELAMFMENTPDRDQENPMNSRDLKRILNLMSRKCVKKKVSEKELGDVFVKESKKLWERDSGR